MSEIAGGGSMFTAACIAAISMLAAGAGSVEAQAEREALIASLDSAAYAWAGQAAVPGVSVAVVHRGDTLLMRGYGYVDLEWEVATPRGADASYEIGSITKQFTAASVMQLVEQGKLDLDADFTDYIDFDTQGHLVTVRRLLDHTSGIKGYTEMSAFGELTPRKLPRDTMVRLIESEPFDFEPGTALIYNNSAFFFLGLIIAEVSGQTYEEYVAENIFEALGMDDSYYCSESAIRGRRAHGYDADASGLQRKRYLDHTWPYAAGSLCSTVGDLVRWNQALHGGEIVSAESYRLMTTPVPLEDGTPIRYAMGLVVDAPGGRRTISHGGGINGFVSDGRYYPDDGLIIVALQNSTGANVGALGSALADIVLGPAPQVEPTPYTGDLQEFVGSYTGPSRGRSMTMTVSIDDGGLVMGSGRGEPFTPDHRDALTWANGNLLLTFVRKEGRIHELRVDSGGGHYVLVRGGS